MIQSLRAVLDRPLKSVLLTGDTSLAIKDLPRDPYLRVITKPVKAEELLTLLQQMVNSGSAPSGDSHRY